MVKQPNYEKPPAIEALIELLFAEKLTEAETRRGADALSRDDYPSRQLESGFEVRLQVNAPPQVDKTGMRWVLRNATSLQTVIVQEQSLIFSRLAPYPGWDEYFSSAWSAFSRIRAKLGYRRIARVGVRFVNRLDLPDGPDGPAVVDDYVTTGARHLPLSGLKGEDAFMTQTDYHNVLGTSLIVIRSGSSEPAIIGHRSILLDIDVQNTQVPQLELDLQQLIHNLRDVKNALFLACVTPKAEALFKPKP